MGVTHCIAKTTSTGTKSGWWKISVSETRPHRRPAQNAAASAVSYILARKSRRTPETALLFVLSLSLFSPAVFAQGISIVAGNGAMMHFLVSMAGILIMSGMAWVISWYKGSADKSAKKGAINNADMAGGSL